MAKKKSWFGRIKRLFFSDSKPNQGKSGSKKRWIIGSLKNKRPLALSPSSPMRTMSLTQAQQEQSKHALAFAAVTAAAAEAAVAATQAAAEFARLTGNLSCNRDKDVAAAIKIQAVFRGNLARKALQALRGLVKLQALIRGQLVRRHASATLKSLQSMMKIQSQACPNRLRTSMDHLATEYRDVIFVNSKESPDERAANNGRKWNNSILSKEDINTVLENRREAAFKRLRALQYASFHQRKNLPMPRTPTAELQSQGNDLNRRWSWLEQWIDAQLMENDPSEEIIPPSPDDNPHYHQGSDKIISFDFQDIEKAEEVQLRYLARRSFMKSQRASTKDENSLSSSPSQPGYMAPTASAKAKLRSVSTPIQRLQEFDICYDHCAFSPFPSIVGGVSLSKSMKPLSLHRRSPELKCQTPVRSQRSSNHLSFDSDICYLKLDQPRGFR